MPVKINTSATVLRARTYRVVVDNITMPSGVTTDMHVLRHPGAAVIVPIKAKNRVVLIRQYRHAVGDYIWEVPAGTLEPPEKPLACAQRELVEETGFSAGHWENLGEILPAPGYSDERMYLFLATDLKPTAQDLDEDELICVHEFGFGEAMKMIDTGEIEDAKTICGLLRAARRINQPSPRERG